MDSSHDVRILNSLIETTLDSANGYSEAAAEAENPTFRRMFEERAAERRDVVRQLQKQVQMLGGDPESTGSTLAAAHRVFLSLRDALSRDDEGVVEEVERGEDFIKAKYENAMEDSDLSAAVRDAVVRAYGSVKLGHDQVRDLKHAMRT